MSSLCFLIQEEHIKKVTKEFCDWVASLGGKSNNIEESTITSLFASGYETKPALSVPIHVVELTNVPPELRMSAKVTPPKKNLPKEELKKTKWVCISQNRYSVHVLVVLGFCYAQFLTILTSCKKGVMCCFLFVDQIYWQLGYRSL